MRSAALLSVVGVVFVVAACGLDAVGALTPAPAIPAGDAGPDASPLLDAAGGVDATDLDAGSLDGSSDGDASPVAFCAGQTDPAVSQCWDFETAATSIGAFDPQASDGTTAVVTAGGSHAMSITLPVGTASRAAWVRKAIGAFGPGSTTYEIRFRFAIPTQTIDYAGLGGFRDSNGSIFGAASYGQGAGLELSVTAPMGTAIPVTAGPSWHSAAVAIQQGMVRPTAKVAIDGTVVFDGVWDIGANPTVDLRLGVFYTAGNTGAYEVLFDDVLLRHQ